MTGGKLLFRVETKSFETWDPIKVRLDNAHNFAAWAEWHESLDTAIEYAKRKQDEDAQKTREQHHRSKFRVVDHLGHVHWKGNGVQ